MYFLIAIGIFVCVVGSTWWFGLWNNILTLINFFLAALIASSFYENLALFLQENMKTYALVLDFVSLWLLFFLSFGILRALTELLSPIRLKFNMWVDLIGRSVVCVWLAVAMVFFVFFSIHLAPLPPSSEDLAQENLENPVGTTYLGFGPGRMWMAFIQSRSRGALSAGYNDPFLPTFYNVELHPDDHRTNRRVFDSTSRMPVNCQKRRIMLSQMSALRNSEEVPTTQ